MAGVDHGVIGQHEQRVADRAQDGGFVAEAPPGRSGPAAEQRVAAEDDPGRGVVEAAAAGGVARCVQDGELVVGHLQCRSGREVTVGRGIGPDHVPQHPVVGVQQDGRVDGITERHGGVDVIVVPVGEHDRAYPPTVDRGHDRLVVVGGVEHDDLAVVADDPDVVGDLPLAVVEREDPVGRDEFDRHQNTTTLRRTSPRSILWNASSTPSRPIVSDTKPSRSSRPWR